MSHSVPAAYRTTPQASKRRLGRASLMAWATAVSSLAAFLFTAPAWADPVSVPGQWERLTNKGVADTISVEPDGVHRWIVTYHNSVQELSIAGEYTFSEGDMLVVLTVIVGGADVQGRETVTALPQEPYIAIPPELSAHDGEDMVFLITLPMF